MIVIQSLYFIYVVPSTFHVDVCPGIVDRVIGKQQLESSTRYQSQDGFVGILDASSADAVWLHGSHMDGIDHQEASEPTASRQGSEGQGPCVGRHVIQASWYKN